MNKTKIATVLALLSLTIMMVPVAFADGGVLITKEPCDNPTTNLPQGEYLYWYVTITVTNNNPYAITNVKVSDRFGGEFGVEIQTAPSQGTYSFTYSGATAKVSFFWDIGTLAPGASATVVLNVFTDVNPGGKQEFTSCGEYYMNSGAVVKWLDDAGKQGTATSESIILTVV